MSNVRTGATIRVIKGLDIAMQIRKPLPMQIGGKHKVKTKYMRHPKYKKEDHDVID